MLGPVADIKQIEKCLAKQKALRVCFWWEGMSCLCKLLKFSVVMSFSCSICLKIGRLIVVMKAKKGLVKWEFLIIMQGNIDQSHVLTWRSDLKWDNCRGWGWGGEGIICTDHLGSGQNQTYKCTCLFLTFLWSLDLIFKSDKLSWYNIVTMLVNSLIAGGISQASSYGDAPRLSTEWILLWKWTIQE